MNKSFKELQDILYSIRTRPSNYFELLFQLTSECNFRCTYCYETKYKQSVSYEDGFTLIDKMFDFEDNLEYWGGEEFFVNKEGIKKDNIEFNFFGGECTLEIDKMEAFCQHFIDKCDENLDKYQTRKDNFSIIIQSNAYLFQTKKVKDFLIKWKDRLKVFATIDGCQKVHDSCRKLKEGNLPTWKVVKNNLIWFKNTFNYLPATKGTLVSETLPYLYETYKAYKEIGYTNINITPAIGYKFTDEDVKIYKEQLMLIAQDMLKYPEGDYLYQSFINPVEFEKERRTYVCGSCRSNGTGVCLASDGKLYSCYVFAPITLAEKYKMQDYSLGNVKNGINQHGLEVLSTIRHMADKYQTENEDCGKCLAYKSCEFCPGINLKMNGDINIDSKLNCKMKKVEQSVSAYYYYLRRKLYGDIKQLYNVEVINESNCKH